MKHKHAELMAAYAADAQTTDKPWELWEYQRPCFGSWHGLLTHPTWENTCEYRRKPKTNLQVACELLDTALDDLEEHSTLICEPNVDYIQTLIMAVKKLLQEPQPCAECAEVKVTTTRCSFCDEGEGKVNAPPTKQYTVRIQETAQYERKVFASDEDEAVQLALAVHTDDNSDDRDDTCVAVLERDAEVVK